MASDDLGSSDQVATVAGEFSTARVGWAELYVLRPRRADRSTDPNPSHRTVRREKEETPRSSQ